MSAQHKIDPSYQPKHHHQFYQLTVPFTPEEVQKLHQQKASYEKTYQVSFIDLGSFISYIVAKQLLDEKEAIHFNNTIIRTGYNVDDGGVQISTAKYPLLTLTHEDAIKLVDCLQTYIHVFKSKNNHCKPIKELDLVEATHAIGLISTSNCHYTAGLTAKLATLNKSLLSITLGELIALDKDFNNSFNQMMGM